MAKIESYFFNSQSQPLRAIASSVLHLILILHNKSA